MHQPEELEIIGIDVAGPRNFLVATKCSGECFNQNFPKRIRHSFKFNGKYLAKHDDGEYHFIKKMRKMYSSQDENIANIEKINLEKSLKEKVTELNQELTSSKI